MENSAEEEAMEADLRRDTPPPQQQPDLGDASGSKRTYALSEESGVTADSSRPDLCGHADSSPVQSTEWTNKKHNLYLDSLERSFVDQLNHSKRMRGGLSRDHTQGPYPSSEPPLGNFASSDEFKVMQDGCWQKINFQRTKSRTDARVVNSPWIHHFTTSGNVNNLQPHTSLKQDSEGAYVTGSRTLSSRLAFTSRQQSAHRVGHQNPLGDTAEVTDQNFVEEVRSRSSARSPTAKRRRRSSPGGSINDQVVPSGEYHKADASVGRYASSGGQRGSLSEEPD